MHNSLCMNKKRLKNILWMSKTSEWRFVRPVDTGLGIPLVGIPLGPPGNHAVSRGFQGPSQWYPTKLWDFTVGRTTLPATLSSAGGRGKGETGSGCTRTPDPVPGPRRRARHCRRCLPPRDRVATGAPVGPCLSRPRATPCSSSRTASTTISLNSQPFALVFLLSAPFLKENPPMYLELNIIH